jgi:hypothetical protein
MLTKMNTKRWHLHIEPGDANIKAVDMDIDEIEDAHFIVELGPDWSALGYKITITYNDPTGNDGFRSFIPAR